MRLLTCLSPSMSRIVVTASLCFSPLVFSASAQASSTAHSCNCTSGITVQQAGSVTIYRGPSVSYDYRAADRARQAKRQEDLLAKQQRLQNRKAQAQAERIAKLEGRVEGLEARAEDRQRPRRRSGRTFIGNPRFFGRNGFLGNSNFSGGSVQLSNPRRYKGPASPKNP